MAKEAYTFMNNQVLDHNGNEIEIEAFHPGEFLREEIEERNLLKKDVAKALNILPHHLSEIFAGKRNISATLAVRLEKLLEISSHYWLGLQMEYDLFLAKQEEALV
jgi:HTH-type transcriptional regulator/antitoxin HigA